MVSYFIKFTNKGCKIAAQKRVFFGGYSLSSYQEHQNGVKFGCRGHQNREEFGCSGHWNGVKSGCPGHPNGVKFQS